MFGTEHVTDNIYNINLIYKWQNMFISITAVQVLLEKLDNEGDCCCWNIEHQCSADSMQNICILQMKYNSIKQACSKVQECPKVAAITSKDTKYNSSFIRKNIRQTVG